MAKLLIGNWKVKLNEQKTLSLSREILARLKKFNELEIVLAPNLLYLSAVKNILAKSEIELAAQDIAAENNCTGEISAAILKDVGCKFAIVGHPERRQKLGETDAMINRKINQCLNNGLTPILCVGEDDQEKSAGSTEAVLVRQLHAALEKVNGLSDNEIVIAYEPVWAIGTGHYLSAAELASPQRIIKRAISGLYSEKFYDEKTRLVYGGSVNSIIAGEYWDAGFLDGLFVGNASLDAEEFYNIASQSK